MRVIDFLFQLTLSLLLLAICILIVYLIYRIGELLWRGVWWLFNEWQQGKVRR